MTAALRLDPGFDAYGWSDRDRDRDRDQDQDRDHDQDDERDHPVQFRRGSRTGGLRLRPVADDADNRSGDEYLDIDLDLDDDELDEPAEDLRPRRTVRRGRVHRPRTVAQTRTHGGAAARTSAAREVRPMVRATNGVVIATAPQLRVVPTRRRAARLVSLGFAVVFVLMIGAAAFQTQLARRQVELDKVDRMIRNANEDYSQLRQQRAELRAPGRLASEASKLGMEPGQRTTFVALDPEVVAEVQRSAGGVFDGAGTSESAIDEYAAVKRIVGSTP